METIYLVIESTSEDYHGVYNEVMSAYRNKDDAQTESDRLNFENNKCDVGYDIEEFRVL